MHLPSAYAAVVLAVIAPASVAQKVDSIDVLWAGTYDVGDTREVADPTSPMGRRFVSGGVQPLVQTDRIAAVPGTRFGIGFVLHGEPAGAAPDVHALWRFPPRGLLNPETRTTTYEWKMALRSCRIEMQPYCLVGYPLRHPWELVPGRWTIEIWSDGRKLAQQSFDLYLP